VTVLVIVVVAGRQQEVLLEHPEVLTTIMGPEVDRREGIAALFQALLGRRDADGRLSWYLAAVDELAAVAAQGRASRGR